MTPKEKAEELYSKFYYAIPSDEMAKDEEASKKCALIAVDEILKSNEDWDLEQNIWCDTGFFGDCQMYWIEVKQKIENL